MNDFKRVSAIRDGGFSECKPVSTLVGVNEFTKEEAKIKIEVTAILEK